jgi:hypothetical protein
MEMTRAEHLQWAKDRANAYVDQGEMVIAYTSMASDLSKHPETENHCAIDFGFHLLLGGHLATAQKMRDFINGFN